VVVRAAVRAAAVVAPVDLAAEQVAAEQAAPAEAALLPVPRVALAVVRPAVPAAVAKGPTSAG
jgi:hypothetical protein